MLPGYLNIRKRFYILINNSSFKSFFYILLMLLFGVACKSPFIFQPTRLPTFTLKSLTSVENNFQSLYGVYKVQADVSVSVIQFFPFHIRVFTNSSKQNIYYYSRPDEKTIRVCDVPTPSNTLNSLAQIRSQLCSDNSNNYVYEIRSIKNSRIIFFKKISSRSFFGLHNEDLLLERSDVSTLLNSHNSYSTLAKESISLISQDNIILTLKGNLMSNPEVNLYHLKNAEFKNESKISLDKLTIRTNILTFNTTYCGIYVNSICQTNTDSKYEIFFLDKQKIKLKYISGNKLFNLSTLTFWIPSVIPPFLKNKLGALMKNSLENKLYRRLADHISLMFTQLSVNSDTYQFTMQDTTRNAATSSSFKFNQNPTSWNLTLSVCNVITGSTCIATMKDVFFNVDFDYFVFRERSATVPLVKAQIYYPYAPD